MTNQDLGPAKETYEGFLSLLKFGSIFVAIFVAFVIWLIA